MDGVIVPSRHYRSRYQRSIVSWATSEQAAYLGPYLSESYGQLWYGAEYRIHKAEDSRSSGLGVSRSSRESSIEAEIGLSEYQVVQIRAPGYQAVKVSTEYPESRIKPYLAAHSMWPFFAIILSSPQADSGDNR